MGTVAEASPGTSQTFRGRLAGLRRIYTRRRGLTMVRGLLEDATGTLPVVWFNRPYLTHQLSEGEEVVLSGAVRRGQAGPELLNPSCERAGLRKEGLGIAPIYGAAGGVGPVALERMLSAVLEQIDLSAVPETLPEELLLRHGLPRLGESLSALHRPGPDADVETLNSRRSAGHLRLIYGELLELQVKLALPGHDALSGQTS